MAGQSENWKEKRERFKRRMLDELPADASPIGNITVRERIGLKHTKRDRDFYWKVRDELEAEGQLEVVPYGGRGGSVKRVSPLDVEEVKVGKTGSSKAFPNEASLYGPMLGQIGDGWAKAMGMNFLVVEQTSNAGFGTGGRWTRPDIAALGVKRFSYLPEIRVDLITFEVKHHSNVREFRLGIYEALAHSRRATQSYLILYVPKAKANKFSEIVAEVCVEASEVGIGVIIVERPDLSETWETRVPAARRDPDPEQLNRFLAGQLSAKAREELRSELASGPEPPDVNDPD